MLLYFKLLLEEEDVKKFSLHTHNTCFQSTFLESLDMISLTIRQKAIESIIVTLSLKEFLINFLLYVYKLKIINILSPPQYLHVRTMSDLLKLPI